MNAYNFVEKGCIFYHVIAKNEEQCYELAKRNNFNVEGMELELEKKNIRDEMGNEYQPTISDAMVN